MPPQVSVKTTARLHLGFLDMRGDLGRKFGGIGLALNDPGTSITLSHAEANRVTGPERARAQDLLETAQDRLSITTRHHLTIHEAIPAHSGLGSGTQLALAIAAALRKLEDLPKNSASDAAMLSRGARSGLGAGLIETGGIVVDGGRGAKTITPPTISRLEFPQNWRVILVRDAAALGLYGANEKEAFASLAPLSALASGELCRLVLMQVLPSLAEREFAAFASAITRIQQIVGDYFSPAQSGRRFTSPKVETLIERLQNAGATGVGQTSWGPTGFAFAESEDSAEKFCAAVKAQATSLNLSISVHRGLNHGAAVDKVYTSTA